MSCWSKNPIRWLRYLLLRMMVGADEARRLSGIIRDPLNSNPPFVGQLPGADPLGTAPGEGRITFVSRHALVESGVYWETVAMREEAAKTGEFWRIRRGLMGAAGEEVEFIHHAVRDSYLVASPDTEHGDHLLLDKTREERGEEAYRRLLAEMNRFVRRDPMELARERLGADLEDGGEGAYIARPMAAEAVQQDIDEDTMIPFVTTVERDDDRAILTEES